MRLRRFGTWPSAYWLIALLAHWYRFVGCASAQVLAREHLPLALLAHLLIGSLAPRPSLVGSALAQVLHVAIRSYALALAL